MTILNGVAAVVSRRHQYLLVTVAQLLAPVGILLTMGLGNEMVAEEWHSLAASFVWSVILVWALSWYVSWLPGCDVAWLQAS